MLPSNTDLPCLVCGYNLRGLADGGRCPECGTAIDRRGPWTLARWPVRLRRRLAVALAGLFLTLLGRVAFAAAVLWMVSTESGVEWQLPTMALLAVGNAVIVGGLLMARPLAGTAGPPVTEVASLKLVSSAAAELTWFGVVTLHWFFITPFGLAGTVVIASPLAALSAVLGWRWSTLLHGTADSAFAHTNPWTAPPR